MAVPAIDLAMELGKLNLKGDVVPAQEVALVFLVADYIDLDWGQCELVDLLNALFAFHIKLHASVVDAESL